MVATASRLLLLALALGWFPACRHQQATAPASPPVEVEVTQASQQDVPIYNEYVGSLDGLVNADIQARVSGYLISQKYKEGTAVKKGDLLFEIDPRPFEAAQTKAKASVAQ